MAEYYVFATQAEADTCLNYINSTPWFPVTGKTKGVTRGDAQKTTKWADAPVEMVSGEYAVHRIPTSRLDYLNVPQEDRDAFIAAYGQDIRTLTESDFVQPVEE